MNKQNSTLADAYLTFRERTVLRLAALGLCCKEIAQQLGISKETVKKHRKNALKKTGRRGRAAFIQLAYSQQQGPLLDS